MNNIKKQESPQHLPICKIEELADYVLGRSSAAVSSKIEQKIGESPLFRKARKGIVAYLCLEGFDSFNEVMASSVCPNFDITNFAELMEQEDHEVQTLIKRHRPNQRFAKRTI